MEGALAGNSSGSGLSFQQHNIRTADLPSAAYIDRVGILAQLMLKPPSLFWRALTPRCTGSGASFGNRCRAFASNTTPDVSETTRDTAPVRKVSQRDRFKKWERRRGRPLSNDGHIKQPVSVPRFRSEGEYGTPSLLEQLFPEEAAHNEAERAARHHLEVPPLPLEAANPTSTASPRYETETEYFQQLRHQLEESGPQTSVLVLRSASKHLTVEDFRRLIPQGKHIEGWTLERGDIEAVISGRDLATLEHAGYYYLLFSSPLSAFAYQEHVIRIHTMISTYTPSSLYSPIPPAPGQLVQGLDVQSAIDAYALTAPRQPLILRQLKPPLSPLIAGIVTNRGYSSIMRRAGRSPFEVRLTLEGPQPGISKIHHELKKVAKERELGWNGDLASRLSITRWEPQFTHNPSASSSNIVANHLKRDSTTHRERDEMEQFEKDRAKFGDSHDKRTLQPVYLIGFDTERAAQSFVQYWHGRPLLPDLGGNTGGAEAHPAGFEGDLPPVVRVEML